MLVATVMALAFAYSLMRMPIQVSDSLDDVIDAQRSSSVAASFVGAIGPPWIRPLRLAQVKALFDLAAGRHYWLAYRGWHAVLLAAALLLFVRALDVRTWPQSAAAVFALTVLTGLHTFRGLVREAYPINHFLEIAVLCLVALNLSRARGGWWVDVGAAVTFMAASLTLESGLLVWVILVAAWVCGMRGVSRRGVLIVTGLAGLYMLVRVILVPLSAPDLTERSSGYLLSVLEPEQLQQRFGDNPIEFYVYNVMASIGSILFGEPTGGVFEGVRAWRLGDAPPRLVVAIVSSVITTAVIGWVVVLRLRARPRPPLSSHDQLLVLCGVVLLANAAMAFAYAKDEIISVAGVFYAYAAFVAAHAALARAGQPRPRVALCLILSMMAPVWAFRSLGVHHMMRLQAFKERNDWVRFQPEGIRHEWVEPDASRAEALVRQLRRDAVEMRLVNPTLLPRWRDRWWGE